MEYKKKFVIIGNKNAVSYKEIFKLIKENKIWLGYTYPNEFLTQGQNNEIIITKQVNGLTRWFANLEIKKRSEILETIYTYEKYPEKYPKYDNYDAINVDKTNEIPMDYKGVMGVPITFLDKHNPKQFEILGLGTGDIAKDLGVKKNYRGRTDLSLNNSKCPYNRILIRQIASVEELKQKEQK